jgi:hypothetical protein
MDFFTKRPEAYKISSEEALTVAEELITNFYHFDYCGSYIVTRAVTMSPV